MNMTRYDTRTDKKGESHIGRAIGLSAWLKYCMPHALASVARKNIKLRAYCGLRNRAILGLCVEDLAVELSMSVQGPERH